MSGADLKPVDVHVDHWVAEVGLDIRHGLPFDLQPIPHPYSSQDLVEKALKRQVKFLKLSVLTIKMQLAFPSNERHFTSNENHNALLYNINFLECVRCYWTRGINTYDYYY